MSSILCLGAGLVTAPGVRYLSEHNFSMTVASRTLSKAQKIVEGLPGCTAVEIDVSTELARLEELVQSHTLTISLLPWTMHLLVVKLALKHKKNFVTSSYISDEMMALDEEFKAAGVVSFNECGVDPGLDHMSAMRIIDRVHAEGGKVLEFLSYCGGLPCPDDNNNPLGYKFSWSPRGVLLAAIRKAIFLKGGETIELDGSPGHTIYDHYALDESVPNVGPPLATSWPSAFECYPNGDSCKYISIYRIPEVQSLVRGTYRNVGWCPTMKAITTLGLLKEDNVEAFKGKPYAELAAHQVGCTVEGLKGAYAAKLGIPEDHLILEHLEWLGLFDKEKLVEASDMLSALCDLFLKHPKFWYAPGERDMLCMHHTFVVEKADGTREKITSTMVEYGEKDGDTCMSRTVSLPLAIMVRRILQAEVPLTGVQRPVNPETYNPVLDEMEAKFGIKFVEKATPL